MLFRRNGTHYFLAEVWREGAGQVFGRGALERELASKQRTGQVERVEARLSAQ